MSEQRKRLIHKIKDAISTVLLLGVVCALLHFTGIGCPIRFMTGISCFGCGMTRALFSALTLHFREAFAFHPLWVLVPVWCAIFFFRSDIPKKWFYTCGVVSVILFALVYFLRLFDGSDMIVVFEPRNGFLFRAVSVIIRRLFL